MVKSQSKRTAKARVVILGGREVIAEGLHLNFWADISHHCMTASWPAFIGGAALVFVAFNAIFAFFYWIGNQPISNVTGGGFFDDFFFSIRTLSTPGYGGMSPQTPNGDLSPPVGAFTADLLCSPVT